MDYYGFRRALHIIESSIKKIENDHSSSKEKKEADIVELKKLQAVIQGCYDNVMHQDAMEIDRQEMLAYYNDEIYYGDIH